MEGHQVAARDESTVPSQCTTICSNAYLESQTSIGEDKNLCKLHSKFLEYYENCRECVETSAIDPQKVFQGYFEPTFGPFLEYCATVVWSTSFAITTTKTLWTPIYKTLRCCYLRFSSNGTYSRLAKLRDCTAHHFTYFYHSEYYQIHNPEYD
ncbi:hypothetical protein QBC38DRAFT_463108 [Podospora fimiseda]|uniref:Uncharacterized protein n=1 Tax=Podospora fimiseda TaxID=252190 RepID=A0AAN7BZK8_9PEZI|nr:hypothetical protein QBC38DRAFT_463108 [Podospora fimiseda]